MSLLLDQVHNDRRLNGERAEETQVGVNESISASPMLTTKPYPCVHACMSCALSSSSQPNPVHIRTLQLRSARKHNAEHSKRDQSMSVCTFSIVRTGSSSHAMLCDAFHPCIVPQSHHQLDCAYRVRQTRCNTAASSTGQNNPQRGGSKCKIPAHDSTTNQSTDKHEL